MANALASALSTAASFARADPSRRHLGVSPSRSGASAFLGRALPCLSRRRPGRKSCEPPRRPAAVLGSREASGLGEQDPDGIVWDTQKYTWRVGGPNDIPCVHLRDVYRGEKPLTPIPSPFCTKSSCPVTIGDRTPLNLNRVFVSEDDRVLLKSMAFGSPDSLGASCSFECDEDGELLDFQEPEECNMCEFVPEFAKRAGPRALIYHDPAEVHAAIVNCGGLCPGINDVVRSIVTTLEVGYGVTKISGVRYGFGGFWRDGVETMRLTRKNTSGLQRQGGSVIGTGRGGGDVPKIVDSIEAQGMNMVFVIGGNGSHAGANAISDECARRGLKVSVVGIPKTIDNDILHIDKTFGFDTAVEEAQKAIKAAAVEAKSALNGVGVVKLMGRQSGFIALHASLANGEVDVCLIPEVDFAMEGSSGVVQHIKSLLEKQGHAIVVVAEGAGQEYVTGADGTDAGGNPILGDIGPWFVKRLKAEMSCDVKYIDPTYMLRGIKANAHDSIYCTVLGQNAVHGAFAGYTGISIGMVNTHAVFLPIPRLIERERLVDPDGRMWHRLLTSTGQPDFVSY